MAEKELIERLEKLERDNRRLKGFAVATLILAAALGAIYATQPVPDVIKAHEFEAVDSTGRVRARMGAPIIWLTDAQGKTRPIMHFDPGDGFGIALYDAQGKDRADMGLLPSGSPSITLRDPQGFRMDLGSAWTEPHAAGATRATSAASIIMFGNDKKHHVIWQAP